MESTNIITEAQKELVTNLINSRINVYNLSLESDRKQAEKEQGYQAAKLTDYAETAEVAVNFLKYLVENIDKVTKKGASVIIDTLKDYSRGDRYQMVNIGEKLATELPKTFDKFMTTQQ